MLTSYLPLVSLTQKVGTIAFSLSIFFGFTLIFLTLFGVRQIFGTYKYLMVIFTSLGVFLASLETILHLNLHFYNGGLVFFTLLTPFDMGRGQVRLLLPAYPGVYCVTISLLAVQFIYRYWALFNSPYLALFRGLKFQFWIFYCLFFGSTWYFGGLIFMELDPISENYFNPEMQLRYNTTSYDIAMLMFLAFDPNNGSTRWKNVSYTIIITIVMGYQYGTMIYCGWKMYSKMEEKLENLSVTLKHHHRQLFKTLVLQITIPTIFLFSPLVFILYLPYLQLELSIPAGAAVCVFSFYPALDSIIVLLVVTEYRVSAKRIWNVIMRKNMSSNIVKDSSLSTISTAGPITLSTLRN